MEKKRVVIGVSSSIAIYRTLDLIRELKKEGHNLWIIMTENATRLVTPIMFQALSGNPVYYETFQTKEFRIGHIELAQKGDLLAIVPATANIIGKLASGVADDLLTTLALAFSGPKVIAPAMNDQMWQNPVVQRNCRVLKGFGYEFIGPIYGTLATGKVGIGHIAPVELIYLRIKSLLLGKKSLKGHRFLISGGRTESPIDPIRVITNRASGKMALTLAKVVMARDGGLTLVAGPTEVEIPDWIPMVRVRRWDELKNELSKRVDDYDCLIMAAAVNDYYAEVAREKLKKDKLKISLKRTPDILRSLKSSGFRIGFSLETESHLQFGRRKLKTKLLNLVVVNTI
ncbi:MAG TPA: bifunctional phosphopantothenoylcysteine decarboxylase/phosphopantothenate--cysteine ligase CoaBC, partial [bacterium (Candidatus Stahlbacteria)]|nr:bifunctional phosphopantothenoylcysteine decarboxylase/phosphopantothenate--cysteine ligase CoaBC [Candidatus Stahlbacteria bacterium]